MSGSNTTSVPPPTFGAAGFIAPAEADILTGALADIIAALGGDANPALSTAQGQLASSLTAICADHNDTFLQFCALVDPATSMGRMQDGIARIYYIERNPAVPTVVTANCYGLFGTILPQGILAIATDNTIYSSTQAVFIGTSGVASVQFQALTPGPIVCGIGQLNRIYQGVTGWDSISNPTAGVVGADVESPSAFENRRRDSVAQNALGTIPAIRGAVLSVANVLDAFVTDNTTSSAVSIDGVTVPPYGLYVCAAGGQASDIATAIWSKKQPGGPMSGNTNVAVVDTNAAYVSPLPTYTISFQTATPQAIMVQVTLLKSAGAPTNALALVQAAVLAAFNGTDGGQKARIGSMLFAGRFYAGIQQLGNWAMQIVNIKLGSYLPTATNTVSATINATATPSTGLQNFNVTSINAGGQIVPNAIIYGGTAGNLTVVSQVSGTTGGVGVYQVTGSTTNTYTGVPVFGPTFDDIQIGAAHVPTLSPSNITLVFV